MPIHKTNVIKEVVLEVDGSVNKNPGQFGVVGIYEPKNHNVIAYKYKGNRLTNQLMEMLAIYHGIEYFKDNYDLDTYTIVSDSLTTINILSGIQNVRNPRLVRIKILIEDLLGDSTLYLVFRQGHTSKDYVGNYITHLVKYYNRTQIEPNIQYGSLQTFIEQMGWWSTCIHMST